MHPVGLPGFTNITLRHTEVELRHQVQPKGVLLCQAHMRPASTMVFVFLVELQGSNLVLPMSMMLVSAFIRYVKP
jgi:hypothetical protein